MRKGVIGSNRYTKKQADESNDLSNFTLSKSLLIPRETVGENRNSNDLAQKSSFLLDLIRRQSLLILRLHD